MKIILSLSRAVFFPAVLVTFLLFQALILMPQVSLAAAVETVTNTNNAGAGSLRQAIANVDSGGTVNFNIAGPGPHTITLASQITIDESMTITGPGADVITIDAQMMGRIFTINDGDGGNDIVVSISGLRFINGADDFGGAIENFEQLSINSCVFEDNAAIDGGAICNNGGTITAIINSTFIGNMVNTGGGAIFNFAGTINTITHSKFSQNMADDAGGAIFNDGPITTIINSIFTGNMANSGGAIENSPNNTITAITNCTFDGNMAPLGGAITNIGTINISFSTITNNTASVGGGISNFAVPGSSALLEIKNTLIVGNTADSNDNCSNSETLTDNGGNISDDNTDACAFAFNANWNSAAMLGPLQDNGGGTLTHALIATADPANPAIDAIALADCTDVATNPVTTDQRFFPRPSPPGGDCDSGAFERQLIISNVPTLSEWGLMAMAGLLGIVGFMVLRRRKASA